MEEGGVQARYVKLTKEQAPVRMDIRPGELNQAIDVRQHVRKCRECRRPLPENFEFPKDEPWTTGIFGCAEDTESCWTGLFCPCVLFGRNVARLSNVPCTRPCMRHAFIVGGGIALAAATATAAFHGIDPHITALLCEGLLGNWMICGLITGHSRALLQMKYHLKDSPCSASWVHCCMHWCALCQEHREMKGHLSDAIVTPMTIVNPPPVQEMTSANDSNGTSPPSANSVDHASLEMQVL